MNNVIVFPGFCQNKNVYAYDNYADIWDKKFHTYDVNGKEYIIAHSLGSIAALLHFESNKDAKLVLFNPLIPRRSKLDSLKRYLKMLSKNNHLRSSFKGLTNLQHLPIAVYNASKLLGKDPLELIKDIPRDKIIIIKGSDDKYFFDDESVEVVKSIGIEPIVLKNVGHFWTQEVDNYIKNNIFVDSK